MARVILFILTSLLCAFSATAQTGSVKGKITDAETGEPLIGANVVIIHSKLGAATDISGEYVIKNIPPGTYSIKVSYVGYYSETIKNIDVQADSVYILDAQLNSGIELQEIICSDKKIYSEGKTNTVNVFGGSKSSTRSNNVARIAPINAGVVSGRDLPQDTEEYSAITENSFFDALKNPLSTFAIDVDCASYSNVRRFLNYNWLPYPDAVRVEELINYFEYDYLPPKGDDPFSVNMEYSDCPWNEEGRLVQIGIRGKRIAIEELKPSNLVFLIDVSGSMGDAGKLPLLKKSFRMMVDQLKEEDRVSIVVYASETGVALPSTSGADKEKILGVVDELRASGSTAGGEGIQLAYKVAAENFIEDGNNRVILATDGDFNVGISRTSELVKYIESKRNEGIYLTALGFGMGNYKDDKLQRLADNGNGNHAYIDNPREAKKVMVTELLSNLYTIAKDVKIQVEFNPARVASYRLVGYENRIMDDQDFEDEKKDAGEIGPDHTVTALYEIIPAQPTNLKTSDDLKYVEKKLNKFARETGELLTVKIRYKDPENDKSSEIVKILMDEPVDPGKSSDDYRFAASVAQFGLLLRDSAFKGSASFDKVLTAAENSRGSDLHGYRKEFIELVQKAKALDSKQEKEALLSRE